MTTVVTGWTGRAYDPLGYQFLDTLDRYWPPAVGVSYYVDAGYRNTSEKRAMSARLLSDCDGLVDFIARHKDDKAATGRRINERWKAKEVAAGYSFRFDAVRFATQLFIPEAAARHLPDGEILAWFDADVVTNAAVPEGFVEGLIGGADLVYLGREPKHSEIGFWAVRLNPLTRWFLSALANVYRQDKVFSLAETHSAFVFDHCRREFEQKRKAVRNLTPGGSGHVWPKSPLGACTEHLKGKRKHAFMRAA